MRGEETAAMGMLDAVRRRPGLFSWNPFQVDSAERSQDREFTTCMTGEIYSALRKCTILERTMTKRTRRSTRRAFHDGVARSADSGGLFHHLFGVRTLALMGQLREEASASYLSGLLIGHEVRATMPAGAAFVLVGAAQLCGLYAQAIEACGGGARWQDEDAAALGLAAIGRRLHWT